MRKETRNFKIGIVLTIILAIIGIFVFVNADNSKSYVVDVVNAKDTDTDKDDNTEIQIQKKIVKDNAQQPYYNEKDLTYQVDVTNIQESKTPEIALIIDTSYSMGVNDSGDLMKSKAIELVQEIYSNCNGAKIQLYNAAGAKTNKLTSSGQTTIIDTINSLVTGDGNNIADGIAAAQTSFSASDDVDRYIILFTDATDNTKNEINQVNTNGIKLISVLINNIVSNSYIEEDGKVTVGKVEMVYEDTITDEQKLYDEFDKTTITSIINSSLLNIKLTDTFTQAFIDYFDFELISINENVEETSSGYIWTIDNLKSGESKSLQFKLKIKDNIEITDSQYLYHDLSVSEKIVAEYEMEAYEADGKIKDSFTLDKQYMPTVQICDKYSVTLKAVSEENNNLTIQGIGFNVTAKDINGNIVYNQTLTTNDKGEVVIDNLKTTGTVHFEIKPTVNQIGYSMTDTAEIDITNNFGKDFTVDTPEWVSRSTIDNSNRNITINIPINTQKFKLEVNLTELNNSNVTIGNTEFRLIQPKLNDKYEMQAIYGETDSTGKLVFNPSVMTKAGIYEYILSQMTVQDGYESMGNATIRIEFDNNGNIVENGVEVKYNDNVTGQRINSGYTLISVKNKIETEETFDFELNLVDEDDSKIKLDGAEYNIEVSRGSSKGELTNTYYKNITDDKGKINITLPGSGYVKLKITQVKAKTGYNLDEETKIITIYRENGTVQEVKQAYNENSLTSVNASAYSGENKVVVNLSNKIKNERNIIKVLLTDTEETDIYIPNINLELVNDITKETYTATTDINGLATFQIDDEEQNLYHYTLKVVSDLPSIYEKMLNAELSLHFDQNGHLDIVSDLWDDTREETNPLIDLEPVQAINNGTFVDYEATIHLGATVSASNTYWFEVNLTDADTHSPLEGASYDINITSGDITRKITGRKTDSSGNIKTRLILNEDITIEVTQTSSIAKYKMDNSTKEIVLRYINGKLEFADSSITDTVIQGNEVIYNHTNSRKTGDDVLLDLTIVKEDTNGFAATVPVRIYAEAQGDYSIGTEAGYINNGIEYGSWLEESGESKTPVALPDQSTLDIKTKTDELGTVVLKGLKVNNVPMPGEAEFILYVVEYDTITGQDKENTLVKYKITYRYNENKEIVEITNVEPTRGIRLVKDKTFNGYESYLGYQSNIITTMYTNYDDVGNLSLDLTKLDKDGNELVGAEYDIKVMRPDSSTLSKSVTVENGTVEIPGFMVTVGSQIELTETKAPIGYGVNEDTEIIEVKSIDELGEITLEVQSGNYTIPRIELAKIDAYQTDTGSMKTEYEVKLTDYELDTFNMKIIAIDAKTQKPIEGYSFSIDTSKGAKKTTNKTDGNGEVETLVGGNYQNETVTYNIAKAENTKYYKDSEAFTLSVQFDQNKHVDLNTLNIQTDSNYGDLANGGTWKIRNVNVLKDVKTDNIADRYDVEVEVYIEPEDPLVVEIQTIDGVSGNKLTNTSYTIEPSVNLSGKGVIDTTTQNTIVEIGYVERNASKVYKLITDTPDNYEDVDEQTFTVSYDDNGDIKEIQATNATSMTIDSYNGKTISITNIVEPKQGIQIENNDYFTGQTITGAEFEVTTQDGEKITAQLGLTGITSILGSKHGAANSQVTYKIHQTKAATDFVKVDDFDIVVTYGDYREITDVSIPDANAQRWVEATYIRPSNSTDLGYNGNDKGIVKLIVKSCYDFRVNIENVDRFDSNIKIEGTQYEVTSTLNASGTAQTNIDGIGIAHLDEQKSNTTVVYTIKETAPAADYQALEVSQIDIEVEFDSEGYVVPGSTHVLTGHGDEYATASDVSVITSDEQRFTIYVQITSNPKFRMNIKNIDYFDNTIALSGTEYSITSEIGNSIDKNITDGNGNVTLRVDGNPKGKTVTYTIHEEKSSIGYQTIEEDVKVNVEFNTDGTVKNCNIEQGSRFSSTSTMPVITTTFDNFSINVEIRSTVLLDFVINNISTTKDENGITTSVDKIRNATYKISAIEESTNTNLNVDKSGVTDINGQVTIGMDKALSNKTMKYIITEEKKTVDYEWIDCEIIIQVSFDNDGKMINNSWSIIANDSGESANSFAKITNVVIDDFKIELEIENTPIKEFGIHLVALDKYSQTHINGVVANAYLADNTYTNNTLISDNKYDFDVVNKDLQVSNPNYKYLYTGADRDGDGYVDVADGEDYLSMGEYKEGDNTNRKLRVILKDIPDEYQWYSNDTGTTQTFAIVVDVQFNDEGKVLATTLDTGLNSYIGWLADSQYVSVEPSGYGITIRLNFYPMLHVKLESQDMYTGEILESTLKLSTSSYPVGQLSTSDVIQEGYIGNGIYGGVVYESKSSHDYVRTAKAESETERTFYLYEETTPRESENYYQKYRPRDFKYYKSRLIGKIKVVYNKDGTIKDSYVEEYTSNNNIIDNYIDLEWDGYNLGVKVKYVPTTKMVAKIVDRVTGTELNNIRIYPFNEGKLRYQFYLGDHGYETTSSTGEASWIYWGANQAGTGNQYVLKTQFNGSEYNGYYLPGDIKIDVGYSDTGRISTAQVISQNLFEDAANAEVTKYEDNVVYVTIKLDRKFNLKINKKDIYDSSAKLSVKFNTESNRNETASINSGKTDTIGRVIAGEKVKYTLSEDTTIDGYLPLQNLNMYVEFNDDGTIERAYVDKGYEKYFEVVAKATEENGKKGANTTDLEINIKNVPTLGVDVNLTDAFYSNLKLSNATFTITNDKGDNASGSLVTDSEGKISTSIGEVYPNETITYTMKQTNTVNGYAENTTIMEFTVHYNENGNIESYNVTKGNERFTIQPNIYNGTKNLVLEVTNEPKYVNIGIVNLDDNTGEGINNVEYKVDIVDVSTNVTNSESYITQNNIDGDGTVSGILDDVEKSTTYRSVEYKISEITIPNTYRKIQDIDLIVVYNPDGSIKSYNILSNESNVGIEVFIRDTNITKLNGLPTHIKLTIRNDNRYDLIVKDEDTNYAGLGIEGTQYTVSIDGQDQTVPLTDVDGKTGLYKIEGSGTITIRIAENTVGNGYRSDNQNDTTIVLEKGVDEYSLDLKPETQGFVDDKNASTTKAVVVVDEDKGTITVTFKNETKLELDVLKNDINTGVVLENATFEIKAQEVDDYGNKVGTETIITQSGVNDTTNVEGKLYFDLGVTPQNKTIVYTFTETAQPSGYDPIEVIEVTAKFDMYGQLQELSDNSYRTSTAINSTNKNGMVVIIGNGVVNPEYKIKVATEDSVTNKRINDSTIDVKVSKTDGTELDALDGGVTSDVSKGGYLVEKGVISTRGLTESGTLYVDIDQIETAKGYTFSEKTSGTVELYVDYQATSDHLDATINISKVNDDGFEVVVDNNNKEVTIIIKNDPAVTLNIYKYYETYELNDEEELVKVENPLEGAKFTITSEIQTSSEIITTDLNVDSKSTDIEGNTTVGIGEPYAGKTILYTLKETVPDGYEKMDDIIILVQYNTSGNIKYAEVLSNQDVTEITNDGKGTKELDIKVKNTKIYNIGDYKVILEKHSMNDGEYDYLIPDTEYQITVEEEYGTTRTWTDITNEDGIIESAKFSGYGRIKITYTELTSADGYETDNKTHEIEVIRDKTTGYITQITTDNGFRFDEINNIIYVTPTDDLQSDRYDLIINKIDAQNNQRIINNPAVFDVSLIETQTIITQEPDADGNMVDKEETKTIETPLGSISTDAEGKAKLTTIQMPENEGTYQLKITETQAPNGYETPNNSYILDVTFAKNDNGTIEITQINNLSTDSIDILKTNKQLIGINIKNQKDLDDLNDGEFALDITKIDSVTKNAITGSEAIFRLSDENNNKQYIETDVDTGKLQIPYLKMPASTEFYNADGTDKTSVEKHYELKEIMAPDGYLVNEDSIDIKVVFIKDTNDNNTIKIQNVEVVMGSENITATEVNGFISFNIENTEGELPSDDIDRGTYTINIEKVDEDTQESITGRTTFEVTLENGQKVTASTDENGKIQIRDIKVPSTVAKNLGPYSYVIEETKAAEGYEITDKYTIIEITFKPEIDSATGDSTGLYEIDNVVKTSGSQATISSSTTEEVNIRISNKATGHKVTYDANCSDTGITVPSEQTKLPNQDITLDSMEPQRDGYVFKGWAETPDATTADYKPGDTFTKDEDTTLYAVWEEGLYLKSTEYIISTENNYSTDANPTEYVDGDTYMFGVKPAIGAIQNKEQNEGTNVDKLKANIETNADKIEVIDSENNVLGESDLVGTGMKLVLTKGAQKIEIALIVLGDISGNGVLDGSDKTNASKYITVNDKSRFDTIEKELSLDVNLNGKIQPSDLSILRKALSEDDNSGMGV